MRYKSCYWIENGINFDIDSYKLCCLYSAKGGGNTIIENNYKGQPVDWEKIFEFKKNIKDMHKRGEIYPKCEGCIYLEEKDWPDDHSKISMINLNHWTKCNSKCTYCFTMENKKYYNSLKGYNFLPILKDMIKHDILRPYGHVSFGGGEVTLLKEFDKLLEIFMEKGFPLTRIHSACMKYSKAIEKGLKKGCVDLVVSVDAGSKKLHEQIKQVKSYDLVWKNIKKYAENQKDPFAVKVKYIVIPGVNNLEDEIKLFLEKVKSANVNCVIYDIDARWFSTKKETKYNEIMDFFTFIKTTTEEKGLRCELYEHAEHMMSFRECNQENE